MRIPEEVKIGGKLYEVNIVDEIDDISPIEGRILYRRAVIDVRDGENADSMNETFLHELVHGIHHHMGLDCVESDDLDEQYVDGFANALYMVIKDNPGIFSTT